MTVAGWVSGDRVPLLGRAEELAAVVAALQRGGCIVAGPAGVGKSRLAAEAVGSISGTAPLLAPAVRVLATASAASMPFGAISHLLPPESTAAPRIRDVIATLRRRAGEGEPTLLVDDAHLLDSASAALLLALATSGGGRLLLTVRSHASTPDAVTALWKERVIARVDLQPLARSEVDGMVTALLGPSVHTFVYDWIWATSQGNPLYVTELIADARASGRVALRDGRWHLARDRGGMQRVADLIASRIEAVSPAGRDALNVLAIGTPLPLSQLERLVSTEAIEELEHAHLAVSTHHRDEPDVELAHPLYGEVILAQLAESTARRVRRRLAEVLHASGAIAEGDRLRVATWLLEAGAVEPEQFAAASDVALRRGAVELAERLARGAGSSLPACICLARARIAHAAFDEIEPQLAPLEATAAAADLATAIRYVDARHRALLRGTRPPQHAGELIDRVAGWHSCPDWGALIATLRAWNALYTVRPAEAYALLEPWLHERSLSAERRFHVLVVAIYAVSRLCRIETCVELEQTLRAHLEGYPDAPWEAGAGLLVVDGARITAGRDLPGMADRVNRARAGALSSGDRPLAGMLSYVLGILATTRGDAAAAVEAFQTAYDSLILGDPLNAAGAVLLGLAKAHALLGEVESARRALTEAEQSLGERPAMMQRAIAEWAAAAATIEMAAGRLSAARQMLIEVADQPGEDVAGQTSSLYDAVRFGADLRPIADRLQALAAAAQDPLVHATTAHTRALADGDGRAQLAAAERFEELGLELMAAEAAVGAVAACRLEGREDSARRAAALAARCAARCPGVRTPRLTTSAEVPSLTTREREIAELAARGLSNAEIATELVLSVRSVETYVLRVCRKLGITSRGEIAAALGPTPTHR